MPKVSVVLPTYNGEKYIRESIDSVIAQTFSDWELIIVDDCSKDNTGIILDEYEKKDSRIRVIHNKDNQKLPKSLNIGFKESKGQYLTWTSDDNMYEKEALATMCNFLDINTLCGMVRTDMHLIDENSKVFGESQPYSDSEMMFSNLVGACFMYRREAYEKVGEYNPDLFCVEDYDYWLRIMECYGNIGNIDNKLYRYRQHSGSLTEQKKDLVRAQLMKMRRLHLNLIIKNTSDNEKDEFNLYQIMLDCGIKKNDIHKKISTKYILINEDKYIDATKENVIYGAGDFGNKAYKLLKGKVLYYIDKNPELSGQYKNDVIIKTFDEVKSELGNVNLILAVSQDKMYMVINELKQKGIKKFTTFSLLEQQILEGV